MSPKNSRYKTPFATNENTVAANMKVSQIVRQFRPGRSRSTKSNHFLFLSMVGLLWYALLWKKARLTRTIESTDNEIVSSFADTERNLRKLPLPPKLNIDVTPKNSREAPSKRRNSVVRKATAKPSNIVDHDDPFHRRNLKLDNKLKLAEKDPIESKGRVLRAKLSQSVDAVVGNEPIILIWKAMEYQMKHYKEHLEFLTPPECGSCRITTNRDTVRDCSALVHFNSPDLRKFLDLPDPRTRNPGQIYVFWSRETPVKTYHFGDVLKDPRFDNIFNWTMNYRLDSDVIDYFGNVEYELRFFAEKQRFNGWFEKMMSRKSGLAIWAVSNCNNTYGAAERMKYAMKLMNSGLDVTTYGTCFNNRYKGGDLVRELQRHKFYISFENSIHCPDYVSEKFWRNGLRAGAVPIVWGPTKEDVQKVAPDHSFIHVDDFSSPREIVDYVNYLNRNDTAYREYHKWRFQPIDESVPYEEVIPTHRSSLCRLCKKITDKHLVRKTIPSIYNWLYKTRYVDEKCLQS